MNNKKIKLIFLLLVISLILLNIYFIVNRISMNNKTFVILDYDNILKIDNKKIKKVSINKIKYLSYEDAYLLNNSDKTKGYLSLNKDEEVSFYDKNMNKLTDGIIVIDNLDIIEKANTITEKLVSSDFDFIYKVLDENSIDIDLDKEEVYIIKSIMNSNDAVYNILYYNKNQVLSLVAMKNGSDSEVIYNKKATDDYYGTLRGIITLKDNSKPLVLLSMYKANSDYSICTNVYSYNSNKYKNVINCEVE